MGIVGHDQGVPSLQDAHIDIVHPRTGAPKWIEEGWREYRPVNVK